MDVDKKSLSLTIALSIIMGLLSNGIYDWLKHNWMLIINPYSIVTISIIVVIGIQGWFMYRLETREESLLRQIAQVLGAKVGKIEGNPIKTDCKWLVLRKFDKDDKSKKARVIVCCGNPNKPMTKDGCPEFCPYYQSGQVDKSWNAFLNAMLGLAVGAIFGELPALLGALIGFGVGYYGTKLISDLVAELRNGGYEVDVEPDPKDPNCPSKS